MLTPSTEIRFADSYLLPIFCVKGGLVWANNQMVPFPPRLKKGAAIHVQRGFNYPSYPRPTELQPSGEEIPFMFLKLVVESQGRESRGKKSWLFFFPSLPSSSIGGSGGCFSHLLLAGFRGNKLGGRRTSMRLGRGNTCLWCRRRRHILEK